METQERDTGQGSGDFRLGARTAKRIELGIDELNKKPPELTDVESECHSF